MNLVGREGFLVIFLGLPVFIKIPILEGKRFGGLLLLLLLLLLRTTSEVG